MLSQALGFYGKCFLAFTGVVVVFTWPWVLLIPVVLFGLWFTVSTIQFNRKKGKHRE